MTSAPSLQKSIYLIMSSSGMIMIILVILLFSFNALMTEFVSHAIIFFVVENGLVEKRW